MKKLLVLNGSHSDIPLIEAGKRQGYYVITTGNAPDLIGHRYADEYHPADFSDGEAVLNLARSLKIDAVCACANDFGALTAAYVAEKMGLPGHDKHETALTLHHKDQFKAFAIPLGINTPYAQSFSDLSEVSAIPGKMTLPLIIKPIDLTGGKGVTKVYREEDYLKAVQYAFGLSRQKRIVVEELIEGTQHSLTTFIRDRKVAFSFSDNEYSLFNPFLVSTSAAPATVPQSVLDLLVEQSNRVAEELQIVDGVFHLQFLMRDGVPYIIEITRRCSGDLYPVPVDYATGIGWADWIVKAETGADCSGFTGEVQTGFCGRHCIMAERTGKVKSVFISPEIKGNIFDQLLWWEPEYEIQDCLSQKVGILFLRFDSAEEMADKVSRIKDLVRVEFQD